MKNTKTVKTAKKSPAKKSTAKKSDILTTFIGAKTTGTPCVSVIIPVYNVGPYLAKCLDSVLNQTLRDIEVICVDDGSTDYSLEVLKWYASQDPRVTVIGRKNMGVGYSRNQGMEYARGQFIAFMDPDDYYPATTVLEHMYNAAIENDVKICGGSLVVLDENLKQEQYRKDGNNYFPRAELKFYREFQYDYGFQRYIYETKMLRDNGIVFPNYRRYQDPVFMIRAFATAGKFYVIPDYVYGYRYAHRPVGWNEEKVFGLLSGLRDDLRMAVDYRFDKLYDTTLRRVQVDYKKVINDFPSDRNDAVKSEIMDICLQRAASIKPKLDFTPAVSVVLPIYNAAPYLRECLDSVVNQTLRDIEIICVNDGSTDNSLDIIKQYAARDKRVCYIDKPNAGYGQTMNCGINMATGEYIGIVEPDDYIKLDMYSTLYTKAKAYDLDVVKSDYYEYTAGKTKYVSVAATDSYDIIINRFNTPDKIGFSINPTGIFNRNFLKKYNIRFNETPGASHQDIGFALLLSLFAEKFMFIKNAFYMYRQDNANSSMRSYAKPHIMPGEYEFVYRHIARYQKIFKEVKSIFYRLRHKSFSYFCNNRISPAHRYKFMQDWQEIYANDSVFIKSIKSLDEQLAQDIRNILDIKFDTNVIPVVFATDNNYFRYLYVALMSLIEHANSNNMYHVFVFHTDISEQNLAILNNLQCDNVKINPIDVNANIKGQNLYSVAHFSKEMYYRILIPELLSDYSKVLYLDCDILIQRDVSVLYNTAISNYMIGAIKNPPHKEFTAYKHDTLHVDENLYFNSGILLFNTKKCLEQGLKESCFDLLKQHNKLYCPDQDILNMACKDSIKWIDSRWNFQWGYMFNNVIVGEDNIKEYFEASENPFIIHYTTAIKAWNKAEAELSKPWWDLAIKSPFYDSFMADLQPKVAPAPKPVAAPAKQPVAKSQKRHYLRPYLFFPYYLVAGAYVKNVKLPRKLQVAQNDIRGDMNKILREIADLRRMINNTNNNVSAKNDALTRRVDDILTWVRSMDARPDNN